LEGSDQHRVWFQTSLLPAVAVTGAPPFGKVLTHGFVLDGQGKAMSKSAGNVVSPQEVIQKFGADVLRLWVAMTDYREDVRLSPQILERVVDTYRKLRNSLRFLLGNLGDFEPAKHAVPLEKLEPLDLAALGALNKTIEDVAGHYDRFEFHQVTAKLTGDFCIHVLSEYYLDVQKDVLYCDRPDSPRRHSAQTAFLLIAKNLAKMLAPLLSFTAEETWQTLKEQNLLSSEDDARSVFLNPFPSAGTPLVNAPPMEELLKLRGAVNASIEKLRQSGEVKGLPDVHAVIPAPSFSTDPASIASLLGTAQASVGPAVSTSKASGAKCPRCWITRDLTAEGLCARCADAEKILAAQPA
jgi:isoleucyl-tRNA synthetase